MLLDIVSLWRGYHVGVPSFQHNSWIGPGTLESVVGLHNCCETLRLVSPVHIFSWTEQIRMPSSCIIIGSTGSSGIMGGNELLPSIGSTGGGIVSYEKSVN